MAKTGTVKFFNASKGFGFIRPDEGDKDVFVHISGVESSAIKPLVEGQKVSFELRSDKKGKEIAMYVMANRKGKNRKSGDVLEQKASDENKGMLVLEHTLRRSATAAENAVKHIDEELERAQRAKEARLRLRGTPLLTGGTS